MPNTIVVIPAYSSIHRECEKSLHKLEATGIQVIRRFGDGAIDRSRSVLATQAMSLDADNIVWIDSDIIFNPDDVRKISNSKYEVTCAAYPKKGYGHMSFDILQDTVIHFNPSATPIQIRRCGFGFVSVKKSAFQKIRNQYKLPICDEGKEEPFVPYFMPMILKENNRHTYLCEDFAFCERARECGIPIMLDPSIRLFHVGDYQYSYEDSAFQVSRYNDFNLSLRSS